MAAERRGYRSQRWRQRRRRRLRHALPQCWLLRRGDAVLPVGRQGRVLLPDEQWHYVRSGAMRTLLLSSLLLVAAACNGAYPSATASGGSSEITNGTSGAGTSIGSTSANGGNSSASATGGSATGGSTGSGTASASGSATGLAASEQDPRAALQRVPEPAAAEQRVARRTPVPDANRPARTSSAAAPARAATSPEIPSTAASAASSARLVTIAAGPAALPQSVLSQWAARMATAALINAVSETKSAAWTTGSSQPGSASLPAPGRARHRRQVETEPLDKGC